MDELIVLGVVIGALILFISEKVSIDLVAMLIVAVLVLSGVISPAEGVAGFSDPATLTVAFMFVISAAVLRTGVLSILAPRISRAFRRNRTGGMIIFMLLVAFASAFINNTPVVAVLLPIAVQTARTSGIPASQLLMPMSFAAIFGGTTTLIGTSTNILVSGVAVANGIEGFGMFLMLPMGLVFLLAGIIYMVVIGKRLLPGDSNGQDLKEGFGMAAYLTEIELLPAAPSVGKKIMDSTLVRDLDMDIIEIRRGPDRFTLPAGDFVLQAHDLLKVRCDVARIKVLKDRASIQVNPSMRVADDDLLTLGTTMVELVLTPNSELEGTTLRDADLLRKYRAVPLALRHREEVVHDRIHDAVLRSGDVILAEVRSHYVSRLKELERQQDSPFILLAEQEMAPTLNKRMLAFVLMVLAAVVLTSAFDLVPILIGTLTGVCLLVLGRSLSMKDVYDAIDWKIVFLMAGALSLGVAMANSGLADRISLGIIDVVGDLGPVAVLSAMYLLTIILTEIMSNTATAALVAPIAIATAHEMELNPLPFLLAVTFAASASFMTPIGYQTNAMIYSAGRYKAVDFLRVGTPLAILFWILATLLIPVFYPF